MKSRHLLQLESQSIYILREVVTETMNPVLMYSIGKDSSVLLHLARKAFYPAPIPFPVLHIDTKWKFAEMISFRNEIAKRYHLNLIVHTNPDGLKENVNPITHGSSYHTHTMKTVALMQALNKYEFDCAIGGARRDEEKSRAKERIFSFRNAKHTWDPKNQRPEPWELYNTRKNFGESIRVFPLSNWTELDVWEYIQQEQIDIVPLYFSALRPVVKRNDAWIMVDDKRLPLKNGEEPTLKQIRFRTLGCYPLTGAIESIAFNVSDIIKELKESRFSERQGRFIDNDEASSMEKKKEEGYF